MQLTGQAVNDVKASTQQNTQAISKLEQQIGHLATVVGEREKRESFLVSLCRIRKVNL